MLREIPLPPYRRLSMALAKFEADLNEIIAFLTPVVAEVEVDEQCYLESYPDIRDAVTNRVESPTCDHFVSHGYC